jgi:hypothetical protein
VPQLENFRLKVFLAVAEKDDYPIQIRGVTEYASL